MIPQGITKAIDGSQRNLRCAQCDKRLRDGARFCTRCGHDVVFEVVESVALRAPVAPAIQPIPPAVAPLIRPSRRTPPRVSGLTKFGLVCCIVCIGIGVVAEIHNEFGLGEPRLAPQVHGKLPLPAAPDPAMPLPPTSYPPGTFAIDRAWVESDAIDADGYLGMRINALVLNPACNGLRLVAHFNSADSGLIFMDDPRYRDTVGMAAVALPVPAANALAEVSVFFPASAWWLSHGEYHFTLTTALFDESNRPVALGPDVPFEMRGNLTVSRVTRVTFDKPPDAAAAKSMKVSALVSDFGFGGDGQVVVVFRDSAGAALPGRAPWTNAAGELMSKAEYKIPPAPKMYPLDDVNVTIPDGVSRATAEIRLFDPHAGEWVTGPVRVKLP